MTTSRPPCSSVCETSISARRWPFSVSVWHCCSARSIELESFHQAHRRPGIAGGPAGRRVAGMWRRRNVVLPLLLSILCLLVLLFAGRWPSFSSPPPLVTVSLKQKGMAAHQAAGADDWVDASANAVKLGDVRVEIVSAQIGPVDLKRKSSATHRGTLSDDPCAGQLRGRPFSADALRAVVRPRRFAVETPAHS